MQEFTAHLLDWYHKNRILYPWRQTKDPYKIWLSEILLQQTRIPVALPFFNKIVKKYPSVEDVAGESQHSFVAEWSGIGYYGRARNMHTCAVSLVNEHNKIFPQDFEELIRLPGIGRYTAGAIRNVCFDQLTPAIDGNIARVMSRLTKNLHVTESKEFKAGIEKAFLDLGKAASPEEYFQSLMELGEQVCLPRPLCERCPVNNFCEAYISGVQDQIPKRRARKNAIRFFWYFLILKKGEALYFKQNPKRAFLKDAWIFPDVLSETELSDEELKAEFENGWNIQARNLNYLGSKTHSVTYRRIEARAIHANSFNMQTSEGRWLMPAELDQIHTSSIVKKILQLL